MPGSISGRAPGAERRSSRAEHALDKRATRVRLPPPLRRHGGRGVSGSARRAVNAKVPDRYRTVTLKMWAAIWDRAGLQNRPARFNSSAACEESLRRGTRSGPARVSGGEPSPGPARSLVHAWPIGTRHRPSKPARRVRFPPRAQSFCREGWHPSRPHKPDPVGSIPTPATVATHDLPPPTVAYGQFSKSSGLISREATDRREARALSVGAEEIRAGRPRVARLQVGGRLVG